MRFTALERIAQGSSPTSYGDDIREQVTTLLQEYERLRQQVTEDSRRRSEFRSSILAILAGFLLFGAILGFSRDQYYPDPNEAIVTWKHSQWWGLSVVNRDIHWRHDRSFDYPAWMYQDNNGTWRIAVAEPPDYPEQ
jgi:hypothetical protein